MALITSSNFAFFCEVFIFKIVNILRSGPDFHLLLGWFRGCFMKQVFVGELCWGFCVVSCGVLVGMLCCFTGIVACMCGKKWWALLYVELSFPKGTDSLWIVSVESFGCLGVCRHFCKSAVGMFVRSL